jgi:hypothetical protein
MSKRSAWLSFTVLIACGSMANGQAVLSIEPTSQTVSTGSVFNVDVNIANVSDLYGYQFDLNFNPSFASAVSSTEGSFLSKGGSTFFIPGINDNVHGVVSATADTLTSAVPGVSGSGTLAVFTFDAIKPGRSPISISGGTFLDSAFKAISTQSTGGSITVGTIRAPEIEPASASAALMVLLGALAVWRGRPRRSR